MPNPEFLFLSKSHKRALSYLDYGIRERVGFILLTGEVGSGKTTIIRDIINKRLENVTLSRIFNTKVDSGQLISMINDDFGLPVKDKDKISLLRELNDFLIQQYTNGAKPVLIIDEAQNLAPELLEEIRMLSNLETDNAKLLQIILVGQPELRTTLALPAMVQLRQRISINCHLRPLTRPETQEYILHRLEKAGNRNAAIFPPDTLDIIFRYSKGIPRLINIICDFLLLSAFADQTNNIDPEMVKDIIGDLDFDRHFWGSEPPPNPSSVHDGSISSDPHVDESEVYSIIREMSHRLDQLGETSRTSGPELYQEMNQKISVVEQCVKSYREETFSLMGELRQNLKNMATSGNEVPDKKSHDQKAKHTKESFFRRMMGSFDFR